MGDAVTTPKFTASISNLTHSRPCQQPPQGTLWQMSPGLPALSTCSGLLVLSSVPPYLSSHART